MLWILKLNVILLEHLVPSLLSLKDRLKILRWWLIITHHYGNWLPAFNLLLLNHFGCHLSKLSHLFPQFPQIFLHHFLWLKLSFLNIFHEIIAYFLHFHEFFQLLFNSLLNLYLVTLTYCRLAPGASGEKVIQLLPVLINFKAWCADITNVAGFFERGITAI